jgi:hypothetical protein
MENSCPNIDTCPMFKLLKLEASKTVVIQQYCKGDFSKCKRKQLSDEGKESPDNLFPTGELLRQF